MPFLFRPRWFPVTTFARPRSRRREPVEGKAPGLRGGRFPIDKCLKIDTLTLPRDSVVGSGASMNSNLIEEASKVIIEPQVLINMVSKRVRQLSAGSRPMILVEPRMGLSDIALAEIAQGKLTVTRVPTEETPQ